ncbi:MAG: hypothetical protein JO316_10270 [Abitibacteriaceae bacterium]|nr:hypothetical protein [Abditibacteriaceae bacterium]MBV9865726.1 hypothetical protein [Abditibacteriaceae bacterium]
MAPWKSGGCVNPDSDSSYSRASAVAGCPLGGGPEVRVISSLFLLPSQNWPHAVDTVEAMVALVLADHLLRQNAYGVLSAEF